MIQLPLFVLPEDATPPQDPKNRVQVLLGQHGNRPYGKGRPCTPHPPGSGPQGETCGGCFLATRRRRGKKQWIKCARMAHAYTNGSGTDVKAKWPACAAWEPADTSLVRVVRAAGKTAAVYRRKKDRYNSSMEWPGAAVDTEAAIVAWWDWTQEQGWRPLCFPARIEDTPFVVDRRVAPP